MTQTGMRILLLEDNPADAKIVIRALDKMRLKTPVSIEHVDRLSLALACIQKEKFDIILTDLQLPDSDGLGTVTRLLDQAPMVPLAVMTAHYEQEDMALEAIRCGAQDYIFKNHIDSALLLRVIRYAIERKKVQELLNAAITQLEGQKQALDEFAVVAETDAKGRITYVNDQFCKISKYSRAELIGKDHRDVVNSGYHPKEFWRDFWTTIQLGKIWRGDVCNKDKEGTFYWEDTTIVTFLGKDGKPEKYLAIRLNITDRKFAEEEIRNAAQIKSNFTSMVSHELRTPLAIIKESIGVLEDGTAGSVSAGQKKFLEMAKRNVDRLARLINNVLDFQKLESKQMEMNRTPNDINALMTEIRKSFELVIDQKTCELQDELEAGLPPILCDRDKITQVLTNLMSNAVKQTKKGLVTLRTKRLENAVRVCVEDQGPGIKQEDFSKLFKPFSQLATGGERTTGTTGLGLAICKQIIEAHHGHIGVESVYGKGATFYFVLPIIDRRNY